MALHRGGRSESEATTGFSPTEVSTLRAACDTIVPAIDQPGPHATFFRRRASDLGVDAGIVQIIADQFGPRQTAQVHQLLRTFESPLLNLVLGNGPVRFSALGPEGQIRYLQRWRDSRMALKRTGFQALKRLTCSLFYLLPDASGTNPNLADIGYHPGFPSPVPPDPNDRPIRPLDPDQDLELSCDACVIGSGAGGSVAASELQRAGYSVVILEAGEYRTGSSVRPDEAEGTQRSFAKGGTLATDDLSFQLLAGRGAGGGTFVNWMASLRPPLPVLREWESVHGIPGLAAPEFAADVDSVWRALEVNTNESQRNPNNDALWRGCVALGYQQGLDFDVLSRNAVGCASRCDYCGFGCAYACKRSTIVNYLPEAYRAGATFLFDTRADLLEQTGDRVTGVRATRVVPGRPPISIHVKCRVVVLGAGAIETPVLLLRSGIRDPNIGSGLRLHPTTAVAAEMGDAVRPWAGPPQSVVVSRFLDWPGAAQGFWVEAAPAHPGLFALATPWPDGQYHKRWMAERYVRSTATIVLLRDRSRGTVRLDSRGEPSIRYRLTADEQADVKRGLKEAGRILAAAGATSLVTIHSEPVEIRARGDRLTEQELQQFFDGVTSRSLAPNRCLMFSAHLMGSCPMGSNSQRSAVRPTGELWAAQNVFVADGSVFPTAPGVNPMITIMAMARRTSRFVIERLKAPAN